MTAMTIDRAAQCRFFAGYAAYMLGCGATCIRITRNLQRMASRSGADVDMIILPAHTLITLSDKDNGNVWQHTAPIARVPVSYNKNTLLSKLSWDVAEGRLPAGNAEAAFVRITAMRNINVWLVMVLVVFANASFCRLFGGDPSAMAIVAFATFMGYCLKNIMLGHGADMRVAFLVCSFVSAVTGAAGYVFGISSTPEVALGTSVLYLIPGIPYINSVSDLIDGHYLCAFGRFVQAVVLTACIAAGLTCGFLLMNISIF